MSIILKYNQVSMVVLAHSFAVSNFLTDFICLFHILSGYCFKDKYIENKITYIKRFFLLSI